MNLPCGCCELPVAPTPKTVHNRPGLDEIAYRIGTFSSFRAALLRDVSRASDLAHWTARSNDDFGIAILEMWAWIADILTFYQEREANESYLRTATFRESLNFLARFVRYVPAPGTAAAAALAVTLDRGAALTIPPGLRVQSVPVADEKPQKFEVADALDALANLNRFRVYPEWGPSSALHEKSRGGTLGQSPVLTRPLAKGDVLAVYVEGAAGVEEKRLESRTVVDGRTVVTWSPPLRETRPEARMVRLGRRMGVFGANLPQKWLESAPTSSGARTLSWTEKSRTDVAYKLSATTKTFALEGRFENLKVGMSLLMVTPVSVRQVEVTEVSSTNISLGPLVGAVTQITVSTNLGAPTDRAEVTFIELTDPPLEFDLDFAPSIEAGATALFVAVADSAGLAKNRQLILHDDGALPPELVTIASILPGAATVRVNLTRPLTRSFDSARSYAFGNVVRATHGETVKHEVVGSGDAGARFQRFQLAKSPVTSLARPGAPGGVASAIELRVDGLLWTEVADLYGHDGTERVYATLRDAQNATSIQFGDSQTGAAPATGRKNIVAKYRFGLGVVGNVPPATLRNPLDRPVGLRSVTNPLAAVGGVDPESDERMRQSIPNTLRTFGRIVSLRDFECAALEFSGIAKALARMVWIDADEAVELTVAGNGGVAVLGTLAEDLLADLNARRDPNRQLRLRPHTAANLELSLKVEIEPARAADEVLQQLRAALLAHFAFDRVSLGLSVSLSDVYAVAQSVPGVLGVDVNRFRRSATGQPAIVHRIVIAGHELPSIADPESDLIVDVGRLA